MKDDTPQEQCDKEAIGRKILEYREALHMSQEQLSKELGYRFSRKTVHSFEAGTDHIRVGHLFSICAILHISPLEMLPDWLLEKTDPLLFHYRSLSPDQRGHLESYLRFLTEEQQREEAERPNNAAKKKQDS